MATLQIENLSNELYLSIQKLATDTGISISDAIIQLLGQTEQSENLSSQPAEIHRLLAAHPHFTAESLKDALLDAIERADPNYEPAIAEALTETMTTIDDQPTMSADEFREWLTEL
ncbi:MAG: hypothetical protein WBA76_06430 [Phormidesmis sp.]